MNMPDRVIFVSDWHLPPEHTAKTDAFVRFVDEVCANAARVFVLGDLFNAWVGPRHVVMPGHAAALDALKRLAESGAKVVVLRGNRDFLLDQRTLRPYGLELSPGAWRGEAGGKNLMLSHGDELTENDRLHKFGRAVMGNFPVSTFVKLTPLCVSWMMAAWCRWVSMKRRTRRKRKKLQPAERRVRAEFEAGADIVVIGHWHEAKLKTDAFEQAGKTFVMLGECTESGGVYAELSDGTIKLVRITGEARSEEMCEEKKCCKKPEELKGKPAECSTEQVKKCHGDEKDHPCVKEPEE